MSPYLAMCIIMSCHAFFVAWVNSVYGPEAAIGVLYILGAFNA